MRLTKTKAEGQTSLLDLIERIASVMSLGSAIIEGLGDQGINTSLNKVGRVNNPLLLYTIEQSGRKLISPAQKSRRLYNVVLGFAYPHGDLISDARYTIDQLHEVSDEFLQRLTRQDAVKLVPQNSGVEANFTEEMYKYDGQFAIVTLDFSVTIDPNIVTPNC